MIGFAYYPRDPRIRREAEALIEAGYSVDIICLRQSGERPREIINGANVYRVPLQHKRAGRFYYLWAYVCFICMAFFRVSILYVRKRYDLVHVHNMPDALVYSALLPKVCGCKTILDLHDPMPEVYMSKYAVSATHPVIRLLRLMEKCSICSSDAVLTVNTACRDLFISRGCPPSKIHVVMNVPQDSVFREVRKNRNTTSSRERFVIMYHGTVVERNGLAVALDALERVRHKIPNLVFEVYGDGDYLKYFLESAKARNLEGIINYHGFVAHEEIAQAIQSADVGLIPNIASIHWQYATPTRMFEYLYLGKCVIVPRTKAILDCFDERSLYFFESGDPDSLANALYEVYADPRRAEAVRKRGSSLCYRRYRWVNEKRHLVSIVQTLVDHTHNQKEVRGIAHEQ
jgi:glycosyltransferase involved in cell wall biosynthesis